MRLSRRTSDSADASPRAGGDCLADFAPATLRSFRTRDTPFEDASSHTTIGEQDSLIETTLNNPGYPAGRGAAIRAGGELVPIDHIGLGVPDVRAAQSYYDDVLDPHGFRLEVVCLTGFEAESQL
jgi:hypothetical protein